MMIKFQTKSNEEEFDISFQNVWYYGDTTNQMYEPFDMEEEIWSQQQINTTLWVSYYWLWLVRVSNNNLLAFITVAISINNLLRIRFKRKIFIVQMTKLLLLNLLSFFEMILLLWEKEWAWIAVDIIYSILREVISPITVFK